MSARLDRRMTGKEVLAIREKQQMTQAAFAKLLRAKEITVRKWEASDRAVKPLTALLIRITFDPLARAEYLKELTAAQEKKR